MPISLQLTEHKKSAPTAKKSKVAKEKDAFLPDEGQEPANPEQTSPRGNGRRILVADDNAVILKAFEMKLKSEGFVVETTESPAEVVSAAERTKAELIVLDINFPQAASVPWSGFTVMEWLRRFPEVARIPVILITGSEAAHYRDKAVAAGAVAFFQKPVPFKDLMLAIERALSPTSSEPQPQ
jgi:two-component system response regulator GlrR